MNVERFMKGGDRMLERKIWMKWRWKFKERWILEKGEAEISTKGDWREKLKVLRSLEAGWGGGGG
jgi:hypothetical protein